MSALVVEAGRLAKMRINLDDAEIVVKLAPLVGQTYTRSVVSNWLNGTARMPADVLLGLVTLAGPKVSLDDLLFGESWAGRLQALADQVRRLDDRLKDVEG